MLKLEQTAAPLEVNLAARPPVSPPARLPVRLGRSLVTGFLAPAAAYLAAFTLLTWPLLQRFSDGFFCDTGDGLQNAWNLWWFSHSLLAEGKSPFFTDMLHAPGGVTLLGHTLMPFNGLLATGLLRVMTLVQAYNTIIVFTFVASGLTAFWLAHDFVKSYSAALLGGAVFAFSAYRFAHAQGHMNLLSMEFLPLAALCAYRFVTRPVPWRGLALAGAVLLNLLCDYHYFAYSALIVAIMVGWKLRQERSWTWFFGPGRRAATTVLAASLLATSGVIIGAVLVSHARDRLEGVYELGVFSMDAFSPLIPGGHWRFAEVTAWFWTRLPGNIHESSVYVGLGVLLLCAAAAKSVWTLYRAAPARQHVVLWAAIWWISLLLALGPWLRVFGHRAGVPMPYMLLLLVPMMRVPVRFMAVTSLASAVLAAIGWQHLAAHKTPQRVIGLILLLALLAIETLPATLPVSNPPVPAYVAALRQLPGKPAVLDAIADPCATLYFQTIHEKPLAGGYISRVPRSLAHREAQVAAALKARDYAALHKTFGIDYLVLPDPLESPALEITYHDAQATIHKILP